MLEDLKEAGLTKREAQAYLELFNFEEATATELAKLTKEHRTNVYDSLNGLIKKGLVTYNTKKNTKYFRVSDPENLLDFLKEKENNIKKILPKLKAKINTCKEKPSVQVFEGKAGFKAILHKIIREKENLFVLGASEEWMIRFPIKWQQYMKEREKNSIKAKLIYVKGIKPVKHKLNNIRSISEKFTSPSTIAIFGDYVAVFMWSQPLMATLTKSKEVSNSFYKYFEELWKVAKK